MATGYMYSNILYQIVIQWALCVSIASLTVLMSEEILFLSETCNVYIKKKLFYKTKCEFEKEFVGCRMFLISNPFFFLLFFTINKAT